MPEVATPDSHARLPIVAGPLPGRCGVLRNGRYCRLPAGWGTNHIGQGPCRKHFGNNPHTHGLYSKIQREPVRKLYDEFRTCQDPQRCGPVCGGLCHLKIYDELALLRALTHDFIDRYEENREALLAWYQSWSVKGLPDKFHRFQLALASKDGDLIRAALDDLGRAIDHANEGRPREVLDLSSASKLVDTVTRVVVRIEKIRAHNAVARADLYRILEAMGHIVERYVRTLACPHCHQTFEGPIEAIKDNWLQIRLQPVKVE